MDCERARDAILESLFEPQHGEAQAAIEAHTASCQACAAFVRVQRDLDRQLAAHLRPPSLGLGFRAAVRRRVRQVPRAFWPDLLPDALHVASWAVVALLGLAWLPVRVPVVLIAAATGMLITHVLLTAFHETLDAVEDLTP
jgi:predicted anti-sigma-YlaC factor YlaD